jgi:hypothetical protein
MAVKRSVEATGVGDAAARSERPVLGEASGRVVIRVLASVRRRWGVRLEVGG